MSFHRPHRGLPQELRNMIYEWALCPPGGITIQRKTCVETSSDEDEDLKIKKFRSIQPVAAGLLCTDRQVYGVTSPIFYNRNVFALDMSCLDALTYLQSLSKDGLSKIKALSLSRKFPKDDDGTTHLHAEKLCKVIVEDMRLTSLTLPVPDDFRATIDREIGCMDQYDLFTWTLHTALIEAFKGGHFSEIRLAHPEPCANYVDVYSFGNVEFFLVDALMKDWKGVMNEAFNRYYRSRPAAYLSGTVTEKALDAFNKYIHDTWARAGYCIERYGNRPGEDGTVLVIRRVAEP